MVTMKKDLTIEFDVLKKVVYDYSGMDIHSKSRKRDLVDYKKIFCLIAYDDILASYLGISKYIGMTHASVMYHVDTSFQLTKYDKDFNNKYTEIKKEYKRKEKLISAEKVREEIKVTKKYLKSLKKALKKFVD